MMYKPGTPEHAGYTVCENRRCHKFGWVTSVTAKDDGLDSPVWVLRTDCCNMGVGSTYFHNSEAYRIEAVYYGDSKKFPNMTRCLLKKKKKGK